MESIEVRVKTRRLFHQLCRGSALLILLVMPLLAQQGTIQGLVSDPSGAAIPAATVTVGNDNTGVKLKLATNEAGFYTVSSLIPGYYTVVAEAPGFVSARRANFKLDVGEVERIDFTLTLGSVSETVEVRGTGARLDAETSVVGQVIDNKRIVELPLNGRNYLELARLTAGVSPAAGSRTNGAGAFSAAGQRAYQVNILLDGIDNNSRASGGQLSYEAQAVTPSIDAVAEFKVVTNNNSAEYGFRMGGTVVVQTKSGSNQYHGSAYEFLRNDKLDGTNFFAVGQPKPPYRRNQFGATLGGPVQREKLFFFGSYEGTRIRIGETNISTLPTPALLRGDFSGTRPIYDPATTRQVSGRWVRDLFPNNAIPAARFDPVAARAAALYPQPNLQGTVNNNFYSGSQTPDTDQYDGRADYNLSSAHRIFARYSRRDFRSLDPGAFPMPQNLNDSTTDILSKSYVGNWNATLTPSINNEFRFGFTRMDTILGMPWVGKQGIENYNEKIGLKGLPDLGVLTAGNMASFQPTGYASVGGRGFAPNFNNLSTYHVTDHVSAVRGTHVLKAGVEFRREYVYRRSPRLAAGQLNFDGSFTQDPNDRGRTGDAMADLLLGKPHQAQVSNLVGETMTIRNYALFFQDDWRLTRRLTVNLGLRWERIGIPTYRDTPVSRYVFTPDLRSYTVVLPKDASDPGGRHDNNNFAPRIGLAFQATPKTVVRSGIGLFYGQAEVLDQGGAGRFFNNPPANGQYNFLSDRLMTPAIQVSAGYPPNLYPITELQPNLGVTSADEFVPTQYSYQWFVDVQRELPGQTALTLSYLGTANRQMTYFLNINQPLLPGPGSIQSRRPNPFFANIGIYKPGGNASYNALAVKAERRFSGGLTYLASYTWSHMIDDGASSLDDGASGTRNPYVRAWERGNANYDLRHNLVSSFLYDLPVGKGRRWLSSGGPVDWILGGWQVGGILFLRTGRPFSATINGDLANMGTTNFPNRIGNGSLPSDRRSIERWFDVTAFALPAQYTYGNSGRNILRGPGSASMDAKIGKNFLFAEKYRLEFRCEMFNFTNTPNFGMPAAVVNLPQAGQIRAASAPRHIQFGLKFVF